MRTSAKKLEFDLKKLYDVSNVELGFEYWFSKLLNIMLSIFDWQGLPESLPQREIEIQLLLSGHCVVFSKNREVVTTYVSIFDFDKYYQPTKGVYAQPKLGSDNLILNNYDNCIFYNSSLKDNIQGAYIDTGLSSFIARYARLLADTESTYNIYCVNSRITAFPVAKNDKVKTSLEKFFNAFKLGRHEIISDDKIIESFNVETPLNQSAGDRSINWLESRDKILEQFYRDIGVKFRNPKQSQMNVEEVESDEQVLLISLDDMLKCRRDGCDLINKKFGLNVSVKVSDRFNRDNFRRPKTSFDEMRIVNNE